MSASTYADASLSREAQRYVAQKIKLHAKKKKKHPVFQPFHLFCFVHYACISFLFILLLSLPSIFRLPTGICA